MSAACFSSFSHSLLRLCVTSHGIRCDWCVPCAAAPAGSGTAHAAPPRRRCAGGAFLQFPGETLWPALCELSPQKPHENARLMGSAFADRLGLTCLRFSHSDDGARRWIWLCCGLPVHQCRPLLHLNQVWLCLPPIMLNRRWLLCRIGGSRSFLCLRPPPPCSLTAREALRRLRSRPWRGRAKRLAFLLCARVHFRSLLHRPSIARA